MGGRDYRPGMTHKLLSDTWYAREFPVLLEVARQLEGGIGLVDSGSVGRALAMDRDDVGRAFEALIPSYLDGKVQRAAGGVVYLATAKRLTERGRRATGLWPDGDTAVEQLLSALRQAEDLTDDPDDKSALRKASGQLATVSRSVIAEVIAAVVTRQAGMG